MEHDPSKGGNCECDACGRVIETLILPRDCDGGLVDLAAEAAGFHPDERIGIVEDEQDNAAMIDRDLSVIADRVWALKRSHSADESSLAAALECIRKAQRHLDGL